MDMDNNVPVLGKRGRVEGLSSFKKDKDRSKRQGNKKNDGEQGVPQSAKPTL